MSIGSGRGEHEIGLIKEGIDIRLSDINAGVIDNTQRLFSDIKITQLDILDETSTTNCLDSGPYDVIFVPSLFYMLDDEQSVAAIKNMRKLVADNGILCLSFRSRDTWGTWVVDRCLCPVDICLQKLYKRIREQRTYVDKTLHGYRRKLDEISNLISAIGFTLTTIEVALYQVEIIARLPMLNRLMISSLVCFFAGKSSPHLNFLVFKKMRKRRRFEKLNLLQM